MTPGYFPVPYEQSFPISTVWQKSHAKVELVNPLGYQYKSLSLQISFQKSLRLREEMHFSQQQQAKQASSHCKRRPDFSTGLMEQFGHKVLENIVVVNTLLLKAWRHFQAPRSSNCCSKSFSSKILDFSTF